MSIAVDEELHRIHSYTNLVMSLEKMMTTNSMKNFHYSSVDWYHWHRDKGYRWNCRKILEFADDATLAVKTIV